MSAVRDDWQVNQTTGADGRFLINGLRPGLEYRVTASKPGLYSAQMQTVIPPATNLLFTLGFPDATISPTNFTFMALVGTQDGGSLVFSNAATATADLNVQLERIDYHPSAQDWLSAVPDALQIAPGEAGSMTVTASALNLRAGQYDAELVLSTDDPNQLEIRIPVRFLVWREPVLVYGGFLVEDDYAGNGSEILDAGETARIWVYLDNTSGMSDAVDVVGTLSTTNPYVTINPPDTLHWPYIAPYSSRLSSNGVEVVIDPAIPGGTVIEFDVDLTYYDGINWQTNQVSFSYEYLTYHSVSGIVNGVLWDESLQEVAGVAPVAQARVVAEDILGNRYSSGLTGANGAYVMPPLPSGDLWFKVYRPRGSSYVEPAGTNVLVNMDMANLDFLMNNYGSNAPLLQFSEVYTYESSGDNDGAIEAGESFWIIAYIYNAGWSDAYGVADQLALADMGASGPFMSILQDTTGRLTDVPLAPEWAREWGVEWYYAEPFYYFEAAVDAGAVEGDKQRFLLTANDGMRTWPFDFAITVESRISITGRVTYEDNSGAANVTVRAVMPDQSVVVVETDSNGDYAIYDIAQGATNVTISAVPPQDYRVAPLSLTYGPVVADITGADFVLLASRLSTTPSSLSATVNEGESTNAWLTIHNTGTNAVTVDLSVNYVRGAGDLLPPPVDPLATILAGNTLDGTSPDPDDFVAGELEVRFADGTSWSEREAILKRHGLRALFHLKLVPACLAVPIESPVLAVGQALDLAPLAQALRSDPGVRYVQNAAKMQSQALPDDALFNTLYGLHNTRQTGGTMGADIRVTNLWDRTIGSRDIVVAVCDTGFDLTHPDLLPNLWSNPGEEYGDASFDGYPGLQGIDDDSDATNHLYHFDAVSGSTQGPEVVHPLFDPEMWRDDRTRGPMPGQPNTYRWVGEQPNGVPDYFEMYLNGELPFSDLAVNEPTYFGDSNTNGVPDVFDDLDGDGIPDIFADEDGDGIINETGIDFRDEDVMLGDYNNNGKTLISQSFVSMRWSGVQTFTVLLEQWDVMLDPVTWYSDLDLAVDDDDENGYADDLNGWNFFHWDADVTDGDVQSSHGSHVAGTIGAVGNNSHGVAGVNWEVSIMPLALVYRAEDPYSGSPFTTSARIAKAIEYAITHGARVSNHSWGGGAASGVLYEIMKLAERDYNHLFVIAAGNSANDVDNRKAYPAYFSTVLNNVITVAAADHHDQLAEFSNYGLNSVQVAAPGVDIYSTWSSRSFEILNYWEPAYVAGMLASGELIEENGVYYRRMSGTSMAAPHVTGAAALLWSLSPDADYRVIKDALLDGVRKAPELTGWLKTGGLLDLGRSVQVMGAEWLAFGTNPVAIPAGGSVDVEVIFNPDLNTPGGIFQAEIVADSAEGSARVPVTLTVLGRPVLSVESIRIMDDTDGDGFAEPGETVSFRVTLHNPNPNIMLINLAGTLGTNTPGTTLTTATAAWDYLYERSSGESLTDFVVAIPPAAPAETLFSLALTADEVGAQMLTVALPTVERHAVDGRVLDSTGAGVAGAMVEYRGEGSGTALSGSDGTFRLPGLLAGDYLIRAIPTNHTRSADVAITIGASDLAGIDLTVGAPVVSLSSTNLQSSLVNDMTWMTTVAVSNTATDAYAYSLEVMPRRRIGLFSDGSSLGALVAPLRRMGFVVDYYTNNYETVHRIDYVYAVESIVQDVRYTSDDATVFAYDMVIADLTGPQGEGRVFSETEADVFSRYLDLGGTVLFTGGNPLNIPDNAAMAHFCGVSLGKATNRVSEAQVATNWPGAYVTLETGDRLAITPYVLDLATPTNLATEVLFTAGDAARLTRRANIGLKGKGMAMLWSGNPAAADWQQDGVWLDVLRDILRERFVQPMATQTSVPWLTATPVTNTVAGGTAAVSVTFSSGWLAPDTTHAVLLLRGLDRGEEVLALPVSLTVSPYMLRAFTTNGVLDVQGNPLPGDGSDRSPMFQVIHAGTNGLADLPDTASGLPSGDDRLLAVIPSGRAFGRIGAGEGVIPGTGCFDQRFVNTVPSGTNVSVYVRAWDGATFASALAYGDSGVSNVPFSAVIELNFGTWRVNQSISLTLDSNGDSLPDDWLRTFRPDLDPLSANDPLSSSNVATVAASIITQSAFDQPPQPYRVRLSHDARFMFVLDMANNRLITMATNAPSTQMLFGSSGTNNVQFASPEGLAVDPRTNAYRLAVADTGNNRIQLFTYNPTNGVISFERSVGSLGSGTNQFNRPGGVAFDAAGRVFVADTENHRVVIFTVSTGAWFRDFKGTGSYQLNKPRGIAFDTHSTDGGIWVCDTGNNRMTLYDTFGVAKRSFGASGTGNDRFQQPVDVRPWRVGTRRRLVVADKLNGRVQVFNTDGTYLTTAGTNGNTLLVGELNLPHGVEPLNDSASLFVADTGNARIQRFSLTLDADGDGMEDIWEDLNGLNSLVNDAGGDLDGDGLYNIAEYLIGTDPDSGDTNGDGTSDYDAVWGGLNPLSFPPFEIESLTVDSIGGGGSGDLTIQWVSVAGAVYQIETNGSLPGTWGFYTNITATGTTSAADMPPPSGQFLFLRMKRIQ